MSLMSDKKFIKNIEDFTCKNCGFFVKGNGYTNHCPKCLFSEHVDINPGDRKSSCGGLMEPASVEEKSGEYIILHRCRKCGHEKRNIVASNDDMRVVAEIMKKNATN